MPETAPGKPSRSSASDTAQQSSRARRLTTSLMRASRDQLPIPTPNFQLPTSNLHLLPSTFPPSPFPLSLSPFLPFSLPLPLSPSRLFPVREAHRVAGAG